MSNKENDVVEELSEATVGETGGEFDAGTEAGQPPGHVELTGMLEDARSKADEHWNQCLRLQADIENLSKRAERDVANAHKYALDRFAQELLPVRDSLEMGLAAFAQENTGPEKLHEGVDLTLQMLTGVLEKFGIREVNPENETFDPDYHQAVSMQERDDVAPNTVVTVVQKGYLLNDRLIRPAMVIVSKAPGAV
ncbi:MAG: nucleotide exchange factor GrpE [Pseudomonadota bacterium]